MNTITGNEPAQPVNYAVALNGSVYNSEQDKLDGLTIRQHYAGLAMQGLLSTNAQYNGKADERSLLALDAVAHADALIKALNETQQ